MQITKMQEINTKAQPYNVQDLYLSFIISSTFSFPNKSFSFLISLYCHNITLTMASAALSMGSSSLQVSYIPFLLVMLLNLFIVITVISFQSVSTEECLKIARQQQIECFMARHISCKREIMLCAYYVFPNLHFVSSIHVGHSTGTWYVHSDTYFRPKTCKFIKTLLCPALHISMLDTFSLVRVTQCAYNSTWLQSSNVSW